MGPGDPPKAKASHGKFYLLGFLIGLILASALAVLFYKFYYPKILERQALAELNLSEMQRENLKTLENEIAKYKSALDGDVCLMAPLSHAVPLFSTPSPPDGSNLPPMSNVKPENPQVGDNIESATVFVLTAESMGTGFFIGERHVLTNRHVVASVLAGTKDEMIFVNNKSLGKAHPARVVAYSNLGKANPYQYDLAVLEVMDDPGKHGILKFSRENPKRSDWVGAWGYPAFIIAKDPKFRQLTQGSIDSAPEIVYSEGVVSVLQDFQGSVIVNHTAQLAQGNSGGPLVDSKGDVVGINTWINADKVSNSQNQVAQGCRSITKFLDDNGISYRTGS
ncbi:MAG: serine protease [Deltaproteobacteria bacterium]|jgi:S1-C subfamily serine protease|nr:serine protease [Deltaproteobacteria bacterium]